MMGVSTESMTQNNWKYRPMLKGTRKCVNVYNKGTISLYPIEVIEKIKAAQAAEVARDELQQGFSFVNAIGIDDETLERPKKMLALSCTLTQDDRELHDEAAKELPRLSTAKEFSRAIARKKELLGFQKDDVMMVDATDGSG